VLRVGDFVVGVFLVDGGVRVDVENQEGNMLSSTLSFSRNVARVMFIVL